MDEGSESSMRAVEEGNVEVDGGDDEGEEGMAGNC